MARKFPAAGRELRRGGFAGPEHSNAEGWSRPLGGGTQNERHDFVVPFVLVEEGGFEPPKLTQQIYSLPPLATRELLHIYLLELVDGFEPPTC